MKKLLFVITCLIVFNGCEKSTIMSVGKTYSGNVGFTKTCIDEVEYLILSKGYNGFMSPHYRKDGTLYTCK